MLAAATILLPLALALVALAVRDEAKRPLLLPLTGAVHLALSVAAVRSESLAPPDGWFALDPPGRIVLLLVSFLFTVCACYAVAYLRFYPTRPNRVFCGCLLAFLGMMSCIAWSHHLGLMWVALETTTLSSAPLFYYSRTPRSLEAVWKYLLVGSVGIALALLGSLFLGYASLAGGGESSLFFDDLIANASTFSKPWLHAAFILLLVGYGTKMGIAPMHTWKPDAYGEAPGLVGALLAGGMTSCAFLAVLRIHHVLVAAGEGAFASRIVLVMGLLSMAVAGVFMVGQTDFKRMLAYSSVEHMGILLLGLGIGGAGVVGALLHMVNNGLVKGVMFLSAGNIHRSFGSKSTAVVSGAMRRLPVSGSIFLCGFVAVIGSPPFAPFVSEFTILNAAFAADRYAVGALALFFLLVVFVGMGTTVLAVVQGEPPATARQSPHRDGFLNTAPSLFLLAFVLLLGVYLPPPLVKLLDDAVRYLGGAP